MSLFLAQCRRELLLALRNRSDTFNPLVFFALAVLLMGFGARVGTLAEAGPGLVWLPALFANLLAVDGAFRSDHADGTLELLVVKAQPLYPAVLGKLAAHWLVSAAPIVLLSPLALAALFGAFDGGLGLALALALGTAALTLIGAVGAALTVATERGGLLLAVLVLPLYVPVLIFGSAASAAGGESSFALLCLAALLAASVTLAPFAVGKALAISQDH